MKYFGTALTDIGICKKTNQDSVCLKIAQAQDGRYVVLMAIADGMGGLDKGELASAQVIRELSEWFEEQLPDKLNSYTWDEIEREWEILIQEQNKKILDYGKNKRINLGTTLSALLIINNRYMIVHVGDSRIYQIQNRVEQLTEDQTVIAREIKLGHMTEEQAKKDPRKNMLLQCVGASRVVIPDILFGEVNADSVFLMCSDGFSHVLADAEIYEHFKPQKLYHIQDMQRHGVYLINEVKRRKEKDNISIILLKSGR